LAVFDEEIDPADAGLEAAWAKEEEVREVQEERGPLGGEGEV
jgi:hypothetical protein